MRILPFMELEGEMLPGVDNAMVLHSRARYNLAKNPGNSIITRLITSVVAELTYNTSQHWLVEQVKTGNYRLWSWVQSLSYERRRFFSIPGDS